MATESHDFEGLLDALAEAKAALLAAEADATGELIDAKAAYREEQTDENRARKAKAVEVITALRKAVRADRKGTQVAGDAYVTTTDETEGAVG